MDRSEWVRKIHEVEADLNVSAITLNEIGLRGACIEARDKLKAIRLAAPPPPAEQASGEHVEVLAQQLRGRAQFLRARGEVKSPELMEQAAARLAALSQRPGVDEAMVPRKDMADLYAAYVRLLESGRDRIIDLGGNCDPVDMMELTDPYLIRARRTLAPQQPTGKEE